MRCRVPFPVYPRTLLRYSPPMTEKSKDIPGSGQRRKKQRVLTAKGRKVSSTNWLRRQLNDPYVAAARAAGWRSRAAFKLLQMDEKLHFLKPGQRVIDLGAAPGGWSQVAQQAVNRTGGGKGQVVALDLLEMEPLPGVTFLQGDFYDDAVLDAVRQQLGGPADIVLSDMAPNTIGVKQADHLRIMALAEGAFDFAAGILAPGGVFVAKVFQGGAQGELLTALKKGFTSVHHIKPPASRSDSSEMYVVGLGWRGI